jgi:biotin synthase-like enzyme
VVIKRKYVFRNGMSQDCDCCRFAIKRKTGDSFERTRRIAKVSEAASEWQFDGYFAFAMKTSKEEEKISSIVL